MERRYGPPPQVPELRVASGNDPAVVAFLRERQPDIVLARCKQLLSKKVFSIARAGTLVMHPGICPEYRNAHGCFWALAERELERVGMTLLRIDAGIDTGPVFGYYSYPFDERRESHTVIQHRVVSENLDAIARRFAERDLGRVRRTLVRMVAAIETGPVFGDYSYPFDGRPESHTVIQHRVVSENLDAIARRFAEIDAGTAEPVDTRGRRSGEWGQPRLSRYLRARRALRKGG